MCATNKRKFKVSIIIVSFNSKEPLKQCLESLLRNIDEDMEIIVVDNASTDGTREMLQQIQWPNLNVIFNKTNLGFAKACNQGAKVSKGDYLLFLNPDTIIQVEVVRELSELLDRRTDVGIVGPKILYPDGALQLSCGEVPRLHYAIFEAFRLWMVSKRLFGGYRYMTWDHDEERDVGWVSGACLMIRRKLFDEVGGFDENFFIYDEDADLCLRVKSHGYRVIYYPKTSIVHVGGESSRTVRAYALVKGYQSKIYYFKKHHGMLTSELLRASLIISSAIKAIVAPIIGIFKREPEYFRIGKAHLIAALRTLIRSI